MNMEENHRPPKRNPLLIGVILIIVGLLFIVGRYVDLGGVGRLWPLFLLIPVIPLVSTLASDPKANAESLIPITILTVLSVYFLWLNYGDWGRVSGTWPVFILGPGLGVFLSWLIRRERRQLVSAVILLAVALVMFLRIWLENAGIRMDRYLLFGILLIVVGGILVWGRLRKGRK